MRRGGRRSGGPTRSERGRGTGRGSSRTSGSTSRSCGGPARRGAGRGESPEEALRRAFEEVEATRIGTTSFDFPALLPLAERRKHLYVVGKTGSGKTTLLSHLLAEDLEAGRGVGVIAPEAELFRDVVLPMVPEHRADQVVYFAPGRPENPVTFNPLAVEEGEERSRAAEELFAIFKRAVGEEELGARMGPILGNAFACLTGRTGSTLFDVKRLVEEPAFREKVAGEAGDPYLREFWTKTYPGYPKGAHLPVVNRLDQFLRPPAVRRALCHPRSSFSIRRALAEGPILLIDLGGLAPDSRQLLGQMLLAKFQLELMRRERAKEEERRPFHLYADEFQTFAGAAQGTWQELLSRGRRYGLALTLAHQHPSQLPGALQDEMLGNVASLVVFALGAKDAQVLRKELVEPAEDGGGAGPVAIEALVTLKAGEAYGRLGGGAWALPVRTLAPRDGGESGAGERIREVSWSRFGVPEKERGSGPAPPPAGEGRKEPGEPEDFWEK